MRCAGAVFAAVLMCASPGFTCDLPNRGVPLSPLSKTDLTGVVLIGTLPAPVSGPFDAQVVFCPQATGAPVSRIQIDAQMPAHQHGMNYIPVVSHPSENHFQIENLVFHMPGVWEITVSAFVGDAATHFTADVIAQ